MRVHGAMDVCGWLAGLCVVLVGLDGGRFIIIITIIITYWLLMKLGV